MLYFCTPFVHLESKKCIGGVQFYMRMKTSLY